MTVDRLKFLLIGLGLVSGPAMAAQGASSAQSGASETSPALADALRRDPFFRASRVCERPNHSAVQLEGFDVNRAYPVAAKAAGIEGRVEGTYVIGTDGQIRAEDVAITSSEPPVVFDKAVISGLTLMKFIPSCRLNVPSPEKRGFVIQFLLNASTLPTDDDGDRD